MSNGITGIWCLPQQKGTRNDMVQQVFWFFFFGFFFVVVVVFFLFVCLFFFFWCVCGSFLDISMQDSQILGNRLLLGQAIGGLMTLS
jgi:hypothetical protein